MSIYQGFTIQIPSWQKFSEIIQMMNSSLQGIVDRWADGKVTTRVDMLVISEPIMFIYFS